MVSIVENRFVTANLALSFFPGEGRNPYCLPLLRLKIPKSVCVLMLNAHRICTKLNPRSKAGGALRSSG